MNCVFVEGLELFAHHGVTEPEQELGRRFRFDLTVEIGQDPPWEHEKLESTVDYRVLADIVSHVASSKRFKLVESLADEIVSSVFSRLAAVITVDLRVSKVHPPLGEVVDAAGVHVVRTRP